MIVFVLSLKLMIAIFLNQRLGLFQITRLTRRHSFRNKLILYLRTHPIPHNEPHLTPTRLPTPIRIGKVLTISKRHKLIILFNIIQRSLFTNWLFFLLFQHKRLGFNKRLIQILSLIYDDQLWRVKQCGCLIAFEIRLLNSINKGLLLV